MQLKLQKKKKKEKQRWINRLRRGADALDPIEQEVMPLSYKFTLIPAPSPAIHLTRMNAISPSISDSRPAVHTHAPQKCTYTDR